MTQDYDPTSAIRAVGIALYALHDALVAAGVVGQSATAENIRRWIPNPDPGAQTTASYLALIAEQLESGLFLDKGPTFTVIDGGKSAH